jgi:hypothetical protein
MDGTTENLAQKYYGNGMKKSMNDAVFAVDGDIIAYRTAAVCEDHFEGAVESIIDTTLKDIVSDTGIHKMRIYLSGEDNFRYRIAITKPYKGNRGSIKRPRFLEHAKEYLKTRYRAIQMHGYEADDGIATDMTINGAIHCGIDKDILQIPGLHYDYVKKVWADISEDEATLRLYRQVLMGDNSDHIPGLPKVGEKTAEKLIFDPETAHEDAISVYKEICAEKLPDVDPLVYFAEQYALVGMVRNVDMFSVITQYVEHDTAGFQPIKLDEEDMPSTGVRL